MNERNGLEFADLLGIASFMLGMENLMENRQQSAQNDVGSANDKQASYLLTEIGKRLDRQDRTLERILQKLEQIESK
ncbi:hypothetical protein D3Z36_14620 [Lachnospiraceae bacterium]|nr:hypothetical protein [Lachnospiraceae bacterium]